MLAHPHLLLNYFLRSGVASKFNGLKREGITEECDSRPGPSPCSYPHAQNHLSNDWCSDKYKIVLGVGTIIQDSPFPAKCHTEPSLEGVNRSKCSKPRTLEGPMKPGGVVKVIPCYCWLHVWQLATPRPCQICCRLPCIWGPGPTPCSDCLWCHNYKAHNVMLPLLFLT